MATDLQKLEQAVREFGRALAEVLRISQFNDWLSRRLR